MIQVQSLSKTYKSGKAGLHPFDHQIPQGTALALTGGNGAGKSTLIKLLATIIKPSSGTITPGGRSFSYMPDDLEFPLQLTAIEALGMLGVLKKVDGKRSLQLLKEVGLYDARHQKIGTFSKGMKQRLSFAQAMLSDDDILILDEPTNGLDPYWIKWLKTYLKKERQEGKTIIFSTHDLSLVEDLADEMLFFYEGKVLIRGRVGELRGNGERLEDVIVKRLEELNG
ncbi:ABC transporter ATP-binding protein [Rossellomorea oryzaecorticis]|uniref:ABC transporter ATP-binding protein n=1 Tax=Rossellomorea oryzaecorticis TaxID=1396505 RepID=A0ABU9K8C2_9BACI